jgi:predicted ATPase with chaperone activity
VSLFLWLTAKEYVECAGQVLKDFASIKGLTPANKIQMKAVSKAMTEPFTLIQGPPGTGKTATAVRIAALFIELNKRRSTLKNVGHSQVLICGPSNKSVDVLAGK